MFTQGGAPDELAEASMVYSLIKEGLLAPFTLENLDALPQRFVGRLLMVAHTVNEVRNAKTEGRK